MKVKGKDDIPYMKWKIKTMFQTTKQFWFMFQIPRDSWNGRDRSRPVSRSPRPASLLLQALGDVLLDDARLLANVGEVHDELVRAFVVPRPWRGHGAW